jgi:hypothetical protein
MADERLLVQAIYISCNIARMTEQASAENFAAGELDCIALSQNVHSNGCEALNKWTFCPRAECPNRSTH